MKVEEGIQMALGCSAERAEQVAAASAAWWDWHNQNWQQAATAPPAHAVACADAIKMPQLEAFRELCAKDKRGIVLSGLHMGSYVYALLKILLALPDREVLICRRRAPSEEEQAFVTGLAQLGITAMVVRTGVGHPVRLVRALRRGGVVITFHDLPGRWGETIDVSLFARPAGIVVGPALIALFGRARLVPFAAFQTIEGGQCHLEDGVVCKESDDPKVARAFVSSYLARHIEAGARAAPEQWLHWSLLPEILAKKGGIALAENG